MASDYRIYAATTGQCVTRNVADIDEDERRRVSQDFYAGVRLVVDDARREVRGFVPVRRTAQEAFFGVVTLEAERTAPYRTFRATIEEAVETYQNWTLRRETSEWSLVDRAADGSTADTRPEGLERALRSESPVRVATPSLEAAGDILYTVETEAILGGDTPHAVVVTTGGDPSHLDYSLLVSVTDGHESSVQVNAAPEETAETADSETRLESVRRWIATRLP